MLEMSGPFSEAFPHPQDLLLRMKMTANSPVGTMELWLAPEEIFFEDVELVLNRAREGATFPQLRTSAQACGDSQGSLRVPSSVHGDSEMGWLLTFL